MPIPVSLPTTALAIQHCCSPGRVATNRHGSILQRFSLRSVEFGRRLISVLDLSYLRCHSEGDFVYVCVRAEELSQDMSRVGSYYDTEYVRESPNRWLTFATDIALGGVQ